MTETDFCVRVANTDLEIGAYVNGRNDLVIVINGPARCVGRIILEQLCAQDLRHVYVGDHHFMPQAEGRR
jgi:hypothetical protein